MPAIIGSSAMQSVLARTVWNRILAERVETGFMILP